MPGQYVGFGPHGVVCMTLILGRMRCLEALADWYVKNWDCPSLMCGGVVGHLCLSPFNLCVN
jgi:hypothetical protein